MIFREPTRGIHDGQRPLILFQPLQPADISQATAAATTPAARLALALAAVHAARPKTIRELCLDDIDLGNRRLTLAGHARPLDDLTRHLLLAWLEHRRSPVIRLLQSGVSARGGDASGQTASAVAVVRHRASATPGWAVPGVA